MMKRAAGLGFCLAALAFGCAPLDEVTDDGSGADEVSTSLMGMSYVQFRHDNRRCVSPLCGGVWVHRVGRSTTRCADGTYQAECYVASIDYSALGLDERALPSVQEPGVILRGRVEPRTFGSFGNLGVFVATEGWTPATAAAPTGTTYSAHTNDVRCVRAPCPTIDASRLNYAVSDLHFTGVDLTRVAGVSRTDVNKGMEQLSTDGRGILVAGSVSSGPDGSRRIVASQFWFKVSDGVSDTRFCDTDAECTRSFHGQPVENATQCYCALCPTALLNTTYASLYDREYDRYCTAFRRTCPVARCIAPLPTACVNHTCSNAPAMP